MTPATERKRQQLLHFIRRKMETESAVKGVIAVGSIGSGTAHNASDIDAVVFLDPYDLYIVPAEGIWREEDDSFHSIFTEDAHLQETGLQLDFNRLDFRTWSNPSHEWPEPMKAEIGSGWIAYDQEGQVKRLVKDTTSYTDEARLTRLDESTIRLDLLLHDDEPNRVWDTLGPLDAHDRLNTAYDYVVQMLFAYNQRWRTWKSREMTALLQLPWHPNSFENHILDALRAPSHDRNGYENRAAALLTLYSETVDRLRTDGLYGTNPVSEAFIRRNDEPGRAWNMQEWMEKYRQR